MEESLSQLEADRQRDHILWTFNSRYMLHGKSRNLADTYPALNELSRPAPSLSGMLPQMCEHPKPRSFSVADRGDCREYTPSAQRLVRRTNNHGKTPHCPNGHKCTRARGFTLDCHRLKSGVQWYGPKNMYTGGILRAPGASWSQVLMEPGGSDPQQRPFNGVYKPTKYPHVPIETFAPGI